MQIKVIVVVVVVVICEPPSPPQKKRRDKGEKVVGLFEIPYTVTRIPFKLSSGHSHDFDVGIPPPLYTPLPPEVMHLNDRRFAV